MNSCKGFLSKNAVTYHPQHSIEKVSQTRAGLPGLGVSEAERQQRNSVTWGIHVTHTGSSECPGCSAVWYFYNNHPLSLSLSPSLACSLLLPLSLFAFSLDFEATFRSLRPSGSVNLLSGASASPRGYFCLYPQL